MHRHVVGVPEGVTLLEFEEPSGEQQQPTPEVQEVQPLGEGPDEVAVERQLCERQAPKHIKPPNFQNAVTLLLLYIYIYCCIKFRCWMQTLAALVIQSLSRY